MPPRSFAPVILALRSLFVATCVVATTAWGTPSETASPSLGAQLQAAIESGDFTSASKLAAPYQRAEKGTTAPDSRTACLLGIALQSGAPLRACQLFDAARTSATTPIEFQRASFWLAETLIQIDRNSHASRIAAELEQADRTSLAAAYIRARLVLDEWENLPRAALNRRNGMINKIQPFMAAVSPAARNRSTFEPRFLTLSVDLDRLNDTISHHANGYEEFIPYRPHHLNILRMALAIKLFDLVEYRQNLLNAARQRLPADEAARWIARADQAHRAQLGTPQGTDLIQQLAEEALGNGPGAADLRPAQLWLVQRAAQVLDWREDPRFPAAVARLAPLAAAQPHATPATIALHLSELVAKRTPGFSLEPKIELRLCLLAHDYERGPLLAEAQFPAHAGDAAWIRAYWPLIERGPRTFVRHAADTLLRLAPDNGFALLVSARAHVEDADAAERYSRFFARPPGWGTRPGDWVEYLELCEDAESLTDFLDGPKSTASSGGQFDATLDRWRKALPHDVVVAEQFALRAIRRANAAGGTRDTLLIAADAVADALILGSTAPALVASNAKLQRDAQNLRATSEGRRP